MSRYPPRTSVGCRLVAKQNVRRSETGKLVTTYRQHSTRQNPTLNSITTPASSLLNERRVSGCPDNYHLGCRLRAAGVRRFADAGEHEAERLAPARVAANDLEMSHVGMRIYGADH